MDFMPRYNSILGVVFFIFQGMIFLGNSEANSCSSEIERAQQSVQFVRENWPLHSPGKITSYIDTLGVMITHRAIPHAPFQWRFIIIRDYEVSAMALGDGYILLTDGVISSMEYESEVAAILAHEMGHQIARHLCASGLTGPYFSWFGESKGAPEQMGSVFQVYDLEKEIEADNAAVEILKKSGLDPFSMLHVLEKLADGNPDDQQKTRIQKLRKKLYDNRYLGGHKAILAHDFTEIKQLMK